MIRKLLKVEFRDALSSMLPIGVGMVALSALVALTSVLTGRLGFYSGHWDWLNALLSFATGVCFIAVLVVCFAANVNRFSACSARKAMFSWSCPRRWANTSRPS